MRVGAFFWRHDTGNSSRYYPSGDKVMTLADFPPSTVSDEERLARFILRKSHIRQDMTVKPDAFIPHPHKELSITRHGDMQESALMDIGLSIAEDIKKKSNQTIKICGRADILARFVRSQQLNVAAAPVEKNPWHANITGWRQEKAQQKMKALELAQNAKFTLFQR